MELNLEKNRIKVMLSTFVLIFSMQSYGQDMLTATIAN
mgnify:CR=1 FL=1